MHPLRFQTIDLARNAELCVTFRRDAFACSFADGAARFDAESGVDGKGYLGWLRERLAEFPEGCVHAWDGERIVGQIEMSLRADGQGYINLFYLIVEARGSGAGDQLHRYAVSVCQDRKLTSAKLSVNPENARAVAYYRKHGWIDRGLRPGADDVHSFELTL